MTYFPMVALDEICRPKQWPTISGDDMTESGYPVYGANGRIGYYSAFNHEEPTVLITCRGATCGTINISAPRAYVTGNAMALDSLDKEKVDHNYLARILRQEGLLRKAITGSAQPQITRQSLQGVAVPLPSLAEQKRIAAVLDQVDTLRAKRREAIALLGDLAQSIFLDMFGDPGAPNARWERASISDLGDVVTGNTPPRADPANFGEGIEWVKTDNIDPPNLFATEASERLSGKGEGKARVVPAHAILVTCIAGSPSRIGSSVLAGRKVAVNQQINAFIPAQESSRFLLEQLRVGKHLIQEKSTGAMTGLVNKSQFSSVKLIDPPCDMTRLFTERVERVDGVRESHVAHLAALDELFESLQQRAFSGQLWDHEAA
ncbi:restriction endonuclease subunit S [Streptomyces sp. NBC_00887]|uniref:restriction endonuclease subunit S n=1 Tax=Streptomyces sp. NBC_00887 TaxID=2975859 RepID=UPI00386D615B|nr:restriction endonuclease subunit S [Streptomyces sp. NBC_00887]